MDQALAYYQAALMLTEDNPAPELHDRILRAQQQTFRALADTQRVSGDLENAQANYNGALTAALERNARTEAGELYFVLGTLAADENAWDRALGNYALALENVEPAQRADVKTYQAFAYSSWGDAQRAAGQFDAAASAYTSALECAAELGDAERAGQVLYRFGLLNATLGHWQRALDYYTQAAARLPETETAVREALSRDRAIATRAFKRSQLDLQLEHARTARQASQWDDAATAYRAALGLARDLDDTTLATSIERDWVSLYDDKGAALHGMELWDEANEAYRASLHLACEFDFQDQADARRAHLLALSIDKTKALRAIGKREDAERAAQDTLALTQEFGDTNAQADALYTLGAFAAQDGDWEAAQVYYAQARPLLVAAERSDVLVQLDHDRATAQENLARQAQ
ncbi:MAG: hypothetical protein HY741_26810, partial [Chloroflexi bacterium]|nr:hypothetical protein [Chloroflexota bacterium]